MENQNRKQNWFQKQFSRGNSEDSLPKQGSREAAVAAAAFAIQSVEEAKTKKLKKENGRNGAPHSNGISLTSQFSLKKTRSAVDISKEKAMKPKPNEFGRVHSAAKPSSQSAAIVPIAPGDYAEWYDKLKYVVCGSDKMPKT